MTSPTHEHKKYSDKANLAFILQEFITVHFDCGQYVNEIKSANKWLKRNGFSEVLL